MSNPNIDISHESISLFTIFDEIVKECGTDAFAFGDSNNNYFRNVIDNYARLIRIWNCFDDDNSRGQFRKIIKMSLALGCVSRQHYIKNHTMYPIEMNEVFRQNLNRRNKYKFELSQVGILFETFGMEGYTYFNEYGEAIVSANPGDIVFDVGACFGDTAVYFSERIGNSGKVYAFEPSPLMFPVLEHNLKQNGFPDVIPVNLAFSDEPGELAFEINPGINKGASRIVAAASANTVLVKSTRIDDFVRDNDLHRVDFIKMDIEGAEQSALNGALETIRRFTPKLAICIYHRPDDFYRIPEIILEANPNYQCYLKINSLTNLLEIVMFFLPNKEAKSMKLPLVENEMIRDFSKWHKCFQLSAKENFLAKLAIAFESLCGANKLPFHKVVSLGKIDYYFYYNFSASSSSYRIKFFGSNLRLEYAIDNYSNLSSRKQLLLKEFAAGLVDKFPNAQIYTPTESLYIDINDFYRECDNDNSWYLSTALTFKALIDETINFFLENGFAEKACGNYVIYCKDKTGLCSLL